MIPVALLLIAVAGHAALWIGAVNRLHGIGLPRLWKEVGTWASIGCFFVIPPLVAWRCWSGGSWVSGGMVGFGDPVAGYLTFCSFVAGCGAATRLWHTLGGERSGVVSSSSKRTIDFAAEGDLDRLIPCPRMRRFARLPGNELLRLSIEEKTLRVPGLPDGLAGLKIAHLSDLHISGRVAVDYYARLVEEANAWRPDLVALTGDLIENVASLDWVEPVYGRLAATHGVGFVLGNHDAHGDAAELRRRLSACGHTDLGGRWIDLSINGATLRLAGNERPWFGPAADLASAPPTADAMFALVHGPDRFLWARRNGVSLVLAGHNHGGQIRFPLLGPIVAPSLHGVRYASGAFRRGETVMHVTRGAGTLAPIRYNCPPELSLLTLERA